MAGDDYPGINIGPEPTTDRFTIILHGKEKKVIAGNSLVLHKQLPFRSLQKFGNSFLSRLQCSMVDSNMLNGLGLIDTPGKLSSCCYVFCKYLALKSCSLNRKIISV